MQTLRLPGRASLISAASFAIGSALIASAPGVSANEGSQVQVSSLEVKARIASMEQVNVTAEKAIDANAPAASANVAQLLAELEALELQEAEAAIETAED